MPWTWTITLKMSDEEVGHIEFIYQRDIEDVKIMWMNVTKPGKGLGLRLFVLMLLFLVDKKIHPASITLDDCSDKTLTTNSPYFRWGCRILDDRSREEMKVAFSRYKSFIDMKKVHKYNGTSYPNVALYNDIQDFIRKQRFDHLDWDDFRYTVHVRSIADNPRDVIDVDFDYMKVYKSLFPNGGRMLKATIERVQTKYGARIVYLDAKKRKYIKHNKQLIPLSKAKNKCKM